MKSQITIRPLLLACLLLLFQGLELAAQAVPAVAVEGGDESPYYYLPPLEVQAPRVTLSKEERKRRYRVRYNVRKVYPYAIGALEILQELEEMESTAEKRREYRRFRKEKEKELKEEFTDELKKLSQSQGIILVDMIERERGEDFYHLLKDTKSGLTAFFWQTVAKRFGQNLKDGYDPSKDPYLESLLANLEWP